MFFKELETDRLFLRNISYKDRGFIYIHFSDNGVTRFLLDAEPLTDISGADEIIESFLQPEPRTRHRWILVLKDDGTKIGTCGFHCWDKSRGICEVGYDMNSGYWGKGYMSEAMQTILDFARSDMEVKYVNACIYPENFRSVRVAEKSGFVFNGEMKDEIFRGERYPHRIYTLDCAKI